MNAGRTQGPWRYSMSVTAKHGTMVDSADNAIFTFDGKNSTNMEANAAFIVECVNSHVRMLTALKMIVDSEEIKGDMIVCDFETLQGVARAALGLA